MPRSSYKFTKPLLNPKTNPFKDIDHKPPKSLMNSDMFIINFPKGELCDGPPSVRYPRRVLEMSPVLADALSLPTPDPIQGIRSIDLTDNRDDMIALLDLIWGSINPSDRSPTMVSETQVLGLVKLADKYDVSALMHNVYTVLIFRTEERSDAEQFSSLIYAMAYGDSWLFSYILANSTMDDPVRWSWTRIGLLGYSSYIGFVKAYPRAAPSAGTAGNWTVVSTKFTMPTNLKSRQ